MQNSWGLPLLIHLISDKTLLTGTYMKLFLKEKTKRLVYIWWNISYDVSKTFFYIYSIGRPKHVRVMAGALEGDVFLGPDAEVWLL